MPDGCKLITFEDTDFRGHKKVFRSNKDYVGNRINNSISSAMCKCEHSNNNSSYNNSSSNHNNGSSNYINQCILYTELNYLGRSILIAKNEDRSYVGDKLNNKISSVKVPSICKLIVYDNANFRAYKTEFKNTFSSIGQQWDNRISSAECRCGKY